MANRNGSASGMRKTLTSKAFESKGNIISKKFHLHVFSQQMRKLLVGPHSTAPRPLLLIGVTHHKPSGLEKKGRSSSNSLQEVQSLFIFQQRTLQVRVILLSPWMIIQPIREEQQSVESKGCCLRLSCGKISGSGVLLLTLISCVTLGKSVACLLASVSPL